jgi:hypothetical protein
MGLGGGTPPRPARAGARAAAPGAPTALLAALWLLLFAARPLQAARVPGGPAAPRHALRTRPAGGRAAPTQQPWLQPLQPQPRPQPPQPLQPPPLFTETELLGLRAAARRADPVAAPRRPSGAAAPSAAAAAAPAAAPEFDPALARTLAALQSVAYCPPSTAAAVKAWTCGRCGGAPGFSPSFTHFDEAWDLSGFAGHLPEYNAKVLVFRGTDSTSWSNWVENMRAWRTDGQYQVPGAPKGLLIHSGFMVMWNASSMAAAFRGAYARLLVAHPRGPTFVVGHSMGGAPRRGKEGWGGGGGVGPGAGGLCGWCGCRRPRRVCLASALFSLFTPSNPARPAAAPTHPPAGALAHLAALDLYSTFDPPDLRVFSFGSPRVGNQAFAAFFDEHVAQVRDEIGRGWGGPSPARASFSRAQRHATTRARPRARRLAARAPTRPRATGVALHARPRRRALRAAVAAGVPPH